MSLSAKALVRQTTSLLGLALAALGMSACENDFVKGWEVDRTRVLGAQVEATRVSWLVARAEHSAWVYAVCTDTHLNAPRCDSPVLASGTGTSEDEVVEMDVALPPSSLMLAAFCATGTAALDPSQFMASCDDGSAPLLASVKTPSVTNANPAAPVLFMDGHAVTADTCVSPSSGHAFGIVFRAEDREAGEGLLASTTTTAGELERQYSSLAPDEAAPREAIVGWTAPASGDASVYLVLRDSRGGTSFTRTKICVR